MSPSLRAEVWARPGATTFEKLYADALTARLSGTSRAGGIGDGQFEFPDFDDADTLADLLLRVDDDDMVNAKRALIRVYSDGQTYPPIHEWMVDAVVPPDKPGDRWKVSGTDWLDWLNHAEVFPYDWDGTTTFTSRFPDHIWGGRNVLGELRGSFQPEQVTFTVGSDVDGGTFTISVSTAGGSDTTAAIDFDATSLAVYNALLATSEIDALEVDGPAGGPWTVTILEPEVPIALSTNNGNLEGTWEIDLGGATGGTFTLTFEGQTTGSLNYNDSAATIETAIKALSNVTDATVVAGLNGGDFTVSFTTPDSMTTASLTDSTTGGSGATITENTTNNSVVAAVQTQGVTLPSGWVSSEFSPTDIPHGELQSLRMWVNDGFDPALPTGCTTAIAFNGREPYFPGIEKAVRVQPGGIYQASVYVYARDTDTDIRLVLRDFADNAAGTNYTTEQTVTADTWTQLTITDFQPFDDVDEIKYRIAHVGDDGVDPPIIYVACPELNEGQAPTSIGGVWQSLFDDATSDHSGTRIVWEDEANPGSTWLTLDFDATNDSNGVAWDTSDVEITMKRGWSYGRCFTETARLGYEGRIVPDPVTDGQWLFQLFNPAGMDADYSGSNTVRVSSGMDVLRRNSKRFRPSGTVQAVEGGERQWSIAENAGGVTALGRMERYLPDRDLNGATEIATAASTALASGLANAMSNGLLVMPGPNDPEPLVDYVPGDTVKLLDPPNTETTERVAAINYVVDPKTGLRYDVSMSSERLTGDAAIRAGVIQYLREQKEIREEPPNDSPSGFVSASLASIGATIVNKAQVDPDTFWSYQELSTTSTISFTGMSAGRPGDYSLLMFYTGGGGTTTVEPTGWTLIGRNGSGATHRYHWYARICDGSAADTTFEFTYSGNTSCFATGVIVRSNGVTFSSLPLDAVDVRQGGSGTDADPDPISPSHGSGEYLVVLAKGTTSGNAASAPTGYVDLDSDSASGYNMTQRWYSGIVDIDGTEDPGPIMDDIGTGRDAGTATIAIVYNPETLGTVDASGVATVGSGNTSVTVTHGMDTTPVVILVTPYADPGDHWWVSNIGATTFDINVGTAVGSDTDFSWHAMI